MTDVGQLGPERPAHVIYGGSLTRDSLNMAINSSQHPPQEAESISPLYKSGPTKQAKQSFAKAKLGKVK